MTSPTAAWTALRTAMLDATPACSGDARFIADDSDPEPLTEICRGCPLLAPCSALAETGNVLPVFGIVAGQVRRGNRSSGLMNAKAMGRLVGA
ncbi:hypothetical protein J2X55_002224 [Microbacterium sp. 1154]|uniref:hypothetical protein n=1 Tax=Microbacterium sp. 1154 TaxID=2817733 RepID=UPI00285CA78B|nr:hypothetical protein [Microbacterium sp. 1154]MDR6691312.1 hypothetical protein [Microbacterium sp. 1154]